MAERPVDPAAYYSDAYYSAGEESQVGYSEYRMVATHSLSWAAELIGLLRPAGKVLDVGCADGHLLHLLGRRYELYGIEVNEHLRERCQRIGITILGQDICDARLLEEHSGSFAIIAAMAVLEHVTDIHLALKHIHALLAPDGVLIFEVPFISPSQDNRVWFTSSLEHIYYPTLQGLAYLFEDVFGLPLIGREVAVREYGSTFVGLASRSSTKHRELAELLQRLLDSPIAALEAPPERSFRFFFDLVHAAAPSPENVALLAELDPRRVTQELLQRLAALWSRALVRNAALCESQREAGGRQQELSDKQLLEAQATLVHQLDRHEAALREIAARERQLQEAKAALAQQLERHQAVQQEIAERDRQLQEAQTRIAGLLGQIAERESQFWGLRGQLAAKERQLGSLLTSTSWKITTPLRWAGRTLRKGLSLLRLRPATRLWKALRWAYRVLPVPARAKSRLLAYSLDHGFLIPAPTAPRLAKGADSTVEQEAWPSSQPLVSVVIPSFNYGRYVPEALASVLAQTLQDIEIIVVDGGSTDQESRRVVRELAGPQTKVFLREGRHLVGDNRNFGIERSRGKYLCCLDADDLLRPTYLEKALFFLESQGYDVVSTAIECFGAQTDTYAVERYPALADMLRGNHVPTCAVFRRELWERAGGFQDTGIGAEYFFEDWRLWVRFAALGARIANLVDEPLFRYRVHEVSLSRGRDIPTMESQRQAMAELNLDVLSDEAFALSEARRNQRVRVINPLLNLRARFAHQAGQRTILLAVPFLIVGGAERLLSQIVAHLSPRGYRLVIVSTVPTDPAFGDCTDWFEPSTREIYHLPRFLEPHLWRDFVYYLIETRKVGVLWIVGSAYFYDLLPEIRAAWPEIKAVDLLFNTVGHTRNNRKQRSHIDLNLVENAEVREWLARQGETADRVRLIESGIDVAGYRAPARSSEVLAELGIPASAFIVGFSGRFAEEKCPETFLEIAAQLDEPEIHFLMTGAGPLADRIRQRVERMGMGSRLQFLGRVEDVKRYLSVYDALILPSRLDGRPVVVLESLAAGVPVIASRVGALPELLREGETGFLCEPGDVQAFVERVRWLATRPGEHQRMKAAARAFAEAHLDARRMLEAYEEVFRGLLWGRDSG